MPPRFLIVTGEYPPNPGGVADYSHQVTEGLRRRGSEVDVIVFRASPGHTDPYVHFVGPATRAKSFREASGIIRRHHNNAVVLVQYVPQMYGVYGMNIGFVRWLTSLRDTRLWVMFHEVFVEANRTSPWKHRLLARVTQDMARRLAARADTCFASISHFVNVVSEFTRPNVPVHWLPVPANVPPQVNPQEAAALRAKLMRSSGPLIGHFGTYPPMICSLLRGFLELSRAAYPHWKYVFVGRGSGRFVSEIEAAGLLPQGTATAAGELEPVEVAHWIKACDVMLQPYPDGASTRRSSLMAALALGMPTITNLGALSDPLWRQTDAVYLAERPAPDLLLKGVAKLIGDPELALRLGADAKCYYTQNFSLESTILQFETFASSSVGNQFRTDKSVA